MARQIRIEYPGAIYHITWQRTAGDIRHKSGSISLTRHKIKTTTVSDSDVIRQQKTCPHSSFLVLKSIGTRLSLLCRFICDTVPYG